MLVLTRKPEEKIQIGENITITVLRTKGRAVQIGIEAPRDLRVMRGELLQQPSATSEQQTEATTTTVSPGQRLRDIVTQCHQAAMPEATAV